jgi:hypothetical protein
MHAWLGRLIVHAWMDAWMLMCCVVPTDTVADRGWMRVIAFVALACTACCQDVDLSLIWKLRSHKTPFVCMRF